MLSCAVFFFFNDTATTEIYTLSLHDALPECLGVDREAQPRHLPHLAGQREVVEVLRHRHADGEVHGVASAGDELRRARGGHDPCPALAAVLLPAGGPHPAAPPPAADPSG